MLYLGDRSHPMKRSARLQAVFALPTPYLFLGKEHLETPHTIYV